MSVYSTSQTYSNQPLYILSMAKAQFNCRLDGSIIEWIEAEALRQSERLGRKFSQADVITMLVGSAQVNIAVRSHETWRGPLLRPKDMK